GIPDAAADDSDPQATANGNMLHLAEMLEAPVIEDDPTIDNLFRLEQQQIHMLPIVLGGGLANSLRSEAWPRYSQNEAASDGVARPCLASGNVASPKPLNILSRLCRSVGCRACVS